jgi:hypothetical protein
MVFSLSVGWTAPASASALSPGLDEREQSWDVGALEAGELDDSGPAA